MYEYEEDITLMKNTDTRKSKHKHHCKDIKHTHMSVSSNSTDPLCLHATEFV